MKRFLLICLVVLMVLPLTSCKSAEVKKVEGMISAIGEVTLADGAAVFTAQEAYVTLSASDKEKVENYAVLADAWNQYLTLYIADTGDWSNRHIEYWNLVEIMSRPEMRFFPDGTYTALEVVAGINFMTGTWRVDGETLYLTGASGEVMGWAIWADSEGIRLAGCIPMEQRDAEIAEHFLIVDMSEADPADYFDFYFYEEAERDSFGDPTGNVYTRLMLKNLLLEDGWRCFDADGFLLEVILPAGTTYYTEADGETWQYDFDSYTYTMDSINPPHSYPVTTVAEVEDGRTAVQEFDMDAISFGRMTGHLVFVHESYIESTYEEDGWLMFTLRNREPITSGRYYSDIKY